MSHPSAFSSRANATASSRSKPPGTQSVAEMRTLIGFSAGQISRTASNTSSGKRIRFSREPPYLSVRWFESGVRKLESRYPWAMCSSSRSKPACSASTAARTNSSRTRSKSPSSISRGTCETGRYGIGDGAVISQLPLSSGKSTPSHISFVEPFRPEWPSWPPTFASEFSCTKSTIRRQASTWPSSHRPAHPGVIRPSGETQSISPMTRPAPPSERAPRCTKWKSPT